MTLYVVTPGPNVGTFDARGSQGSDDTFVLVPINGILPNTLQPAALQGQIYFDPQASVVPTASDTNPPTLVPAGQSVAGPVYRSWRGIVGAWGTVSPLLTTATTVTQLSSHTDDSDPIVWMPYTNKAGTIARLTAGAPAAIATGVVLGVVTQKNRTAGANSDLRADIGASGAVALRVQNTDRANSFSFVYKLVSGTTFELDQPYNPLVVPFAQTVPTQNNGWLAGDHVNLQQPIASNIAALDMLCLEINGAETSGLYVTGLTALDPTGPFNSNLYVGRHVNFGDCLVQRCLVFENAADNFVLRQVQAVHNIGYAMGSNASSNIGEPVFIGGAMTNGGALGTATFDGDIILAGFTNVNFGGIFGNVYLDHELHVNVGEMFASSFRFGTAVIYGSAGAKIQCFGRGTFSMSGATFAASLTAAPFIAGTGLLLNTSTTASTHSGASPDVLTPGVTITPAAMDAAGAPGAFILGGAAFLKTF
jgi:hypothetical protein